MAPDPATHDRVYHAIKGELLAGYHRPGTRIDLQAVADRQRASTTPVREAVQRMIGEQLLEPHPDGGVRIVVPDVSGLRDLYVWNAQHLLATLRLASTTSIQTSFRLLRDRSRAKDALDLAEFAAAIFHAIAEATRNLEFVAQVQRSNERLQILRLAEARIFHDLGRELHTLLRNGNIDVRTNLRRRVIAYHRRRVEHAASIIAELAHL